MSFKVRNAREAVLVTGDEIGNHHGAHARPRWRGRTRTMLLDRLAGEGMRLAGFHLPGGGIGRIMAGGSGYRFVQED